MVPAKFQQICSNSRGEIAKKRDTHTHTYIRPRPITIALLTSSAGLKRVDIDGGVAKSFSLDLLKLF